MITSVLWRHRGASHTRHARVASTLVLAATCALGAIVSMTSSSALAAWPDRPIRYVVPYPPGGSSDVFGRALAEQLSKQLGVPVVLDYVPGASGTIGSTQVARAAPDGYTLVHATSSSHTVAALAMKDLPYDPVTSFAPISLMAKVPNAVYVNRSIDVKNAQELITYLKSNPGTSYGHPGIGSSGFLFGEMLKLNAKLDIIGVPYKGSADVVRDVIGGHLQMGFTDLVALGAYATNGQVRVVGVTSSQRAPSLPDVQTFGEAGLPNAEAVAWFGLLAPKGTPDAIVKRLHDETVKALADPTFRARFEAMGVSILGTSPEEFRDFMRSEIKRWGDIAREGNVQFK